MVHYRAEDETIPEPVRGSLLNVSFLGLISHEEQSGSDTTLGLDTRENLVIDAVKQSRDRAENSRLQLNNIVQKSCCVTLVMTTVSLHFCTHLLYSFDSYLIVTN